MENNNIESLRQEIRELSRKALQLKGDIDNPYAVNEEIEEKYEEYLQIQRKLHNKLMLMSKLKKEEATLSKKWWEFWK